jgi:hypothetical protein
MNDEEQGRGRVAEVGERMIQLARMLAGRATGGRFGWIGTDREEEFVDTGSKTSVSIERTDAHYGTEYRMTLRNSRGTPVESIVYIP